MNAHLTVCLTVLLTAVAAAPLRLDDATLSRRRAIQLDPANQRQRRQNARGAQILEQENTKSGDGDYFLSFRTDNGIEQRETGVSYPGTLPQSGTYVKEGTIRYELDDGQTVSLHYVADENGFQILDQSALQQALPTPPPTEYPVPKVPGAGLPVPLPPPQYGLF